MREIIYLRCDKVSVQQMTKRMPQLKRGEIPVKLTVEIDPSVFGSPVIEQHVHITDWRQGMAFDDITMKELTITKEEADLIVAARREKMAEELRQLGYTVEPPPPPAED